MKKGVVLIVVLIVITVLSAFAFIALHFMSNEARITEHKIERMKGFYTLQAAIMNASQRLESGEVYTDVEADINANFVMNNFTVTMDILKKGIDPLCAPSSGTYCINATVNY